MKALVVGGSGYTGGELLRLLLNHPKVSEVGATSRKHSGRYVWEVHQNLRGAYDGKFSEYKEGKVDADVVFLALPHGQSMEHAPRLVEKGVKVVDLSADYRIGDVELFEKSYVKHKSPELLERAVYGLPELFRDDIRKADLVANPGCYPTAAILSIAPLQKFKDSMDLRVIVDSKSGTSGAGATPTESLHHCEVAGNLKPYKVTGHRHQPEMEHILRRMMPGLSVSFTPTLMPVVRGILSNTHVFCDFDVVDLAEHFGDFYKGERFIRIVETATTKNVLCSNYCDISVHYDNEKDRGLFISAIDNLVKGAAGQAVQNMNLVMGYQEDEGLAELPYHP
ncbi:MAG: N-acetyl-gamma-glutamyl-phosphate reductase [Candidatus Altiarchaeales archaeon]|nr:N-acetyl-gamma-glutamyl-phosphate reductase [Candidatus Altiarchaeales archaeon]MBD3417213.1 N-acetyl-gamma-glutamyl-phosphate reductase [Candidatus Altiarchaeales archaeon]